MKQSVAVMDFGTSKITVLVGRRGINNSICIDGLSKCEYDGYANGQWLSPSMLGEDIARAISVAQDASRQKIEKLYIGVPGDFITCDLNHAMISLGKKRRIVEKDIETLYAQGNRYAERPDVRVINIQPIFYTLDNGPKLVAPVGMTASQLGGCISYIQADRASFVDPVEAAVISAGVIGTEYVASPLAETLFLFDDYRRDNCVVLADVGALGTSLTIARGDGIVKQFYFSWGGDCITYALMDALKISWRAAEKLKRSVSLTLDTNYSIEENSIEEESPDGKHIVKNDKGIIQTEYTGEIDREEYTFRVLDVNTYVCNEIGRFARYIDKALKNCDYNYPDNIILSVTGGGLNIRGAVDYLSDILKRRVEFVKPSLPILDDPSMSSVLGVMDMVLAEEEEFEGPAGRLRRWFAKR